MFSNNIHKTHIKVNKKMNKKLFKHKLNKYPHFANKLLTSYPHYDIIIYMVYAYLCPKCETSHDIIKGARDSGRIEYCPNCNKALQRVYTAPLISCTHSLYSEVHGFDMANKHAVKDMQRKYHDQTGSEMLPIGDQKQNFTPKRQEYTITRDMVESVRGDR